jgi:hypothetical protein
MVIGENKWLVTSQSSKSVFRKSLHHSPLIFRVTGDEAWRFAGIHPKSSSNPRAGDH